MSSTARIGTAVAAGYFLGRFKKLRLALIVASALSNENVREKGLSLVSQRAGSLTSSPQAKALTEQISGQLLDAGKAAAMTVAASQVDKLSDRLGERSASLRSTAQGSGSEESDEDQQDQNDEQAEDQDQVDDQDQADDQDEPEDEPEDEADADEGDEPEDEPEDEADADEGDEPEEDKSRSNGSSRRPRRTPSQRRRRSAAPARS